MTPSEARDIAHEHITYWRYAAWERRSTASAAYALVTGETYPGGGWERVAAAMIEWLLLDDSRPGNAKAEVRLAA